MLIGFWAAGQITDAYAVAGGHSWQQIWLVPALFAFGVFVVFAVAFKPETISIEADVGGGRVEEGGALE
jgi:hypothetical protein